MGSWDHGTSPPASTTTRVGRRGSVARRGGAYRGPHWRTVESCSEVAGPGRIAGAAPAAGRGAPSPPLAHKFEPNPATPDSQHRPRTSHTMDEKFLPLVAASTLATSALVSGWMLVVTDSRARGWRISSTTAAVSSTRTRPFCTTATVSAILGATTAAGVSCTCRGGGGAGPGPGALGMRRLRGPTLGA
jgi:hypothetical protein